MRLSVVIPAYNEAGSIGQTLESLAATLERERIPHEIVVVADHCTDGTVTEVLGASERHPEIRVIENAHPPGFGYAVRAGLDAYSGDAAAIMMADLSDSPDDLVTYYRLLERGLAAGFPLVRYYRHMENCLLVAVTETRTKEEIDLLAHVLEASL